MYNLIITCGNPEENFIKITQRTFVIKVQCNFKLLSMFSKIKNHCSLISYSFSVIQALQQRNCTLSRLAHLFIKTLCLCKHVFQI